MNYAEKVWDTINRAWNGDLKAQLSLLCVDVALNGDSRLIEDPRSWSRLSIRRMVNNNDQRKKEFIQSVSRCAARYGIDTSCAVCADIRRLFPFHMCPYLSFERDTVSEPYCKLTDEQIDVHTKRCEMFARREEK